MGVRDALRKAAGLILERPAEDDKAEREALHSEQIKPAGQINRAQPQQSNEPVRAQVAEPIAQDSATGDLDEVTAFGPALLSAQTPEGKKGFSIIYQHESLPNTPFTAEQMWEILASQPPELPMETRKKIVKATLHAIGKSLGATPETVSADATHKIVALEKYVSRYTNQVADFIAKTEKEIVALQAEVAKKHKEIESHQQRQKEVTQLCRAESARLEEVRKFFGDAPIVE